MQIRVHHLDYMVPGRHRDLLTLVHTSKNRTAIVEEALGTGLYNEVAVVAAENLDEAFIRTNNIDSAWSKEPANGLVVVAPEGGFSPPWSTHRSSAIGDIFENCETGELFLVDVFGFTSLHPLSMPDR